MAQDELELEQRLARFEAQLDRFSLTLREWQHTRDDTQRATTPEAIQRRIRDLEETLEREATALRRMHEEPLKQLQAQTASLTEICAAAKHSVDGLDQAESRLAALHTDMRLHLTELAQNFQTLAADMRGASTAAMSPRGGAAAAWPLERVVHLHDELRRGTNGGSSSAPSNESAQHAPYPFTHSIIESNEAAGPARSPNRWWYLLGAVGAIAIVAAGIIFSRSIESKLDAATSRAAAAERHAEAATDTANRQIESARAQADRQITEARKSALRAETIGAVLTAPDLVRFGLTGGAPPERLSAQVLWSRTRGLVLSASRLPVTPPETNYQVWLWANGTPVSGGVFVPDSTGRATLINDVPPKVIGPVVNVEVTVEPSGGRPSPSGRAVLARLP